MVGGTGLVTMASTPGAARAMRLLVTLDPRRVSSRPIWPPTVRGPTWSGRNGACPWIKLAAYGAGIQIHVEALAAHLSGRGPGAAGARWNELQPAYEVLAAELS
jgi:hypothetical protein